VGARVKKAMNEGLELHIDGGTYVETAIVEEKPLRIADLKEGMNHVNLQAEVATKPVVREVRTARDERVKLASLELIDETGRIWFSAWRKHAEVACLLRVSDMVRIEDAYVKRGFGDQREISTSERSCIVNLSTDRS
jgi:ssDNA-binding replication factor A large subunit